MTKEQLKNIDFEKYLLVDIRELHELQELPSLPNATHIPMGEIIKEAEDGTLPKDKTIVTVCRSGGRCGIVNHALAAHGYQVDFLEGGVNILSAP